MQVHSRSVSPAKPQGQGFIAATSISRAGYVTDVSRRLMVTSPSSSGWRRPSRAESLYSGNSSRKSTPRWARLTSPGRGVPPPPTSPGEEMVWCGARKGRRTTSGSPGGSSPATLWMRVISIASSRVSGGMMPGSRRASMVLPAPGGPVMSTLCAPATAISSARLTPSCPMMSEKSASPAGAAASSASRSAGGAAPRPPASICATASASEDAG